MKITVKTLLDSIQAIAALVEIKLPSKSAYKVSKMVTIANREILKFNEKQHKIFEKYGSLIENPDKDSTDKMVLQVKDEFRSQFDSETLELLNEEIDINIPVLKISEIGDVEIPTNMMIILDWFLDD